MPAEGDALDPGGRAYIVGENGPELFRPVTISSAPTGDWLFDALLKELRKHIRPREDPEATE